MILFNLFLTGLLYLKKKTHIMQFASRWLENLRERRIGSFYIFPYHYSLDCFYYYFSGMEFVSYEIMKSQQFYPPAY